MHDSKVFTFINVYMWDFSLDIYFPPIPCTNALLSMFCSQRLISIVNCNYLPCPTESTLVKTRIIFSDQQVVYQRPRQLAPIERIAVDRQVEEWLSEGLIRPST